MASNKIKILETIRQGMVGGGETHLIDLTSRLDKKIFTPIVLSFSNGEMIDTLNKIGIENYVIETKLPFDFTIYNRITSLIREKEIDIIHAHGTRAASNIYYPSLNMKTPYVYTVHGWSFNDSQNWIINKIRRKIETQITQKAKVNICVSESNKLTGIKNIKNLNAVVINNGISFEKFNYKHNCTKFKNEINKKDNEIWIGFIARLTQQKNPLFLIRGFKKASEFDKRLKLLIVGEGELNRQIQKEIEELGLQDKIVLLPFRNDIPEILSTIDIYCLPSLWEGLPIGLIEAMAMKKPVIATNVDGTKEIVNDNNGILIDRNNIDQLYNSILKLAKKETLRIRLGENSYTTVRKQFSIDRMVKQTQDIYLKI